MTDLSKLTPSKSTPKTAKSLTYDQQKIQDHLESNLSSRVKLKPGKKLKYIGQKWSELQTIKYKANTQPFYVLMDLNEENLIKPVAYTPNVDEYFNWLEDGISKFK